MSDRERWTVYPLLFLAIGLAMRAVLVPPAAMGDIDAVRLVCREIVVEDEKGTVVLHLGRIAGGGGRLEINDREGNALMAVGSQPVETSGDENDGEKDGPGDDAERPKAAIEFAGPDGEVVRRLTRESDDSP
jgi:hypothetical protein